MLIEHHNLILSSGTLTERSARIFGLSFHILANLIFYVLFAVIIYTLVLSTYPQVGRTHF